MNTSIQFLSSSALCSLPFQVLLPCYEGDRKRLFVHRTPRTVQVFRSLRTGEAETLSNEAFLSRCRVPADAVDTEEAWRARVNEAIARSRKHAARYTAFFEQLSSMSYGDVLGYQRAIYEWHEKLDRWIGENCGDLPHGSRAYRNMRREAVKAVGDFSSPYREKYPFLSDPLYAGLLPFCYLRDIRVRNEESVKAEIRRFLNAPTAGSRLTIDGTYRYQLHTLGSSQTCTLFEKSSYVTDGVPFCDGDVELTDPDFFSNYVILDDEKMVLAAILPKTR